MTTKKKKNPGGKPTVMTPDRLIKFEHYVLRGLTNKDACYMAGFGESTYYAYLERNPEYEEKIELLRNELKIRTRVNIADFILAGDKDMTKWYAERKMKDEFSVRNELTGAGGGDLNIAHTVVFESYDGEDEDNNN